MTTEPQQETPNAYPQSPTMLDIFSGIGGFSVAGEHAGFRTVAFAETDPYASAILRRHWPDIPNIGDVRNITRDSIAESIDVVAGGFPCQPASLSGQRRGTHDARWLWPECVRILAEFKPPFAVFENVRGMLSVNDGQAFHTILQDLASLRYDALWNCIPAAAVGAPHERDRLWILAHADDSTRTAQRGEYEITAPAGAGGKFVARRSNEHAQWQESVCGSRQVADDDAASTTIGSDCAASQWQAEPRVRRVADGVPNRVDRLRCLGNAIVPQVAELLLRGIYRQLRPSA